MLKIAVLFHENETDRQHRRYVIHYLADYWRARGDDVIFLYGVHEAVPADVIIVHVNLSVVPTAYLNFAARYPIVVNGKLQDIRKSVISRSLLRPGDGWPGAVIVKSNFNFQGQPERLLLEPWVCRHSALARRCRDALFFVRSRGKPLQQARDYAIFESLDLIPRRWFSCSEVVIEKFRPEREDGWYFLRMVQILGRRRIATRLASRDPVIKARSSMATEAIDPDPIVERWTQEFGLDYGKIDYVVADNEPVLLDVNKTIGATSGYRDEADLTASRQYLAEGLYEIVERRSVPRPARPWET